MIEFFKTYKIWILSITGAIVAIALGIIMATVIAKSSKDVFSNEKHLSSVQSSTQSTGNTSSDKSNSSTSTSEGELQETSSSPKKEIPLVITSPSKSDTTVSQSNFAITGSSDPKKPLLINGKAVERLASGEFSLGVELSPGNNTFVFEYDGKKQEYIIRYKFTVIKAYAPYEKQSYEAGSSFVVVALARVNSSSVTATFNGKTINLTPQIYKEGEEFTNFTGSFKLPTGNEKDLDLGGVKFTATCQGASNTYTSPSIICKRDKSLDSTQIVEIVASQAETFNGNTTDDWSRPTNNYLPKGTVDYKVGGITYEPESGNSYYTLRCGKRVYITKKNSPDLKRVTVSKIYNGKLPENNTISLDSNKQSKTHTVLTFNTEWKAPFTVDLAPQSYTNPAKQDYSVSSATYTYVDIKFFYTKSIGGEISFEGNPLIESYQIINSKDGCILRLHLKKAGAFYGWNAEYNKEGQLVFKLLNPPTVTEKNKLKGIKIVIDAGHGGRDVGAPGLRPQTNYEAERNLSLAFKLKAELESYGATVVMTRTQNVEMTSDERSAFLRKESPDLCISIHHDSSVNANANGAGVFYFNAMSSTATKYIYNRTKQQNFYTKIQNTWHYFFLARVTSCPVVLVENGFISNQKDFAGIIDENTNIRKAKAITQGVLDYFNSFYKTVANDDKLNYNEEDLNKDKDNQKPNQEQPVTPPPKPEPKPDDSNKEDTTPDGPDEKTEDTNPDGSGENPDNAPPDDSGENQEGTTPGGPDENPEVTNPDGPNENPEVTNPDGSGENPDSTPPDDSGENQDGTNPGGPDENPEDTNPDGSGENPEDTLPDGPEDTNPDGPDENPEGTPPDNSEENPGDSNENQNDPPQEQENCDITE